MSKKSFKDVLLQSILENKGLSYLALLLAEQINKPILISDSLGRTLVFQNNCEIVQEEYTSIPRKLELNRYYYEDSSNILYLPVGNKNVNGYLIIYRVIEQEIKQLEEVINDTAFALRFYFLNKTAVYEVEAKYREEFIQDLLYNNIVNTDEALQKGKLYGLDLEKMSVVMILESDDVVDIDLLYKLVDRTLRNPEIISCQKNDSIIFICSGNSFENYHELQKLVKEIFAVNDIAQSKLGITFSIGIGQQYSSINEIHKSYQEAKTALAISRIFGETNFIKYFLQLGVFRLLYKHDIYVLKDYYLETLGKIIEVDKQSNGELMLTLETLYDNNMDWKKTADQLFTHVNTLRYRAKKIEELLNIDLNKMENQINLYIALKIRALLKFAKLNDN